MRDLLLTCATRVTFNCLFFNMSSQFAEPHNCSFFSRPFCAISFRFLLGSIYLFILFSIISFMLSYYGNPAQCALIWRTIHKRESVNLKFSSRRRRSNWTTLLCLLGCCAARCDENHIESSSRVKVNFLLSSKSSAWLNSLLQQFHDSCTAHWGFYCTWFSKINRSRTRLKIEINQKMVLNIYT